MLTMMGVQPSSLAGGNDMAYSDVGSERHPVGDYRVVSAEHGCVEALARVQVPAQPRLQRLAQGRAALEVRQVPMSEVRLLDEVGKRFPSLAESPQPPSRS